MLNVELKTLALMEAVILFLLTSQFLQRRVEKAKKDISGQQDQLLIIKQFFIKHHRDRNRMTFFRSRITS